MTQLRRASDALRVVGFDPSLRNWGIARGILIPEQMHLTVKELSVVQPVLTENKQVRNNSKDLDAAEQLAKAVLAAAKGADAIFVEVPHGSQSARAMASYGICLGILGALRATGVPFFEVSEKEVKLATIGVHKSTKTAMIKYMADIHPEAPWPTYNKGGVAVVSEAKAEHMADAVGAIYAGISSKSFQQVLPFITPKPH